ncbi:MAG: hypothetical protein NVSMB7_09030 [Chitinophagaceae bacterium]
MKLIKTCAVVLGMATLTSNSDAQHIKIIEGDLSPLKNEKSINTEFTYENMNVGKKNTETEYVAKKTDEYNKKEAGRGDRWAKDWVLDRKDKYEPKFNELFEKSSDMTVKKDARYTLVYKTSSIEPGYNIGVMRHNAETNAEAWIVETATQKVIAKISVEKAQGRTFWGADYDTGGRIAECYADAGKALGYFIRNKAD